MRNWVIILGILLTIALLYGWRFHPENIGTPYKVFTREAKNNKVGNWRPEDLLDRFNGEGARKKEALVRQQQAAEAAAKAAE